MNEPMLLTDRTDHAAQCSCSLLAQALGLDPRAISFEYCQRVLQKHWRMTCRHGQRASSPAATSRGERWSDVGTVDPVKAILISNGQMDE